jgi:ferredoxin
MRRKVIEIDEEKCTGCGLCIPNCPEGALQIIDGKARLVSDLFCDGLGACIGHCPEGAIAVEEREAVEYDERRVMENIVRHGTHVIQAHLEHLRDHGQTEYFERALDFLRERGIEPPLEVGEASRPSPDAVCASCPGTAVMDGRSAREAAGERRRPPEGKSRLGQWPVQIMLVPTAAPYFRGAHLLLAADCVPFAYAGFHEDLLRGKVLLVGCPKLDDADFYVEKITEILKQNDIRSVTVAHMEVPCCLGLIRVAQAALAASGKDLPLEAVKIGVRGEKLGGVDLHTGAARSSH